MLDDAPDLTVLLHAIRERPGDGQRWLALAAWLWDNGREDQSAAVRVIWPTLRGNVLVSGVPVHETLRQVVRRAARQGHRARQVEHRAGD